MSRRYRYRRRFRRLGRRRDLWFVLSAVAAGVVLAAIALHGHTADGRGGTLAGSRTGNVTVKSASEQAFIGAVLTDLAAPVTAANVTSMSAWFRREWPSFPPGAANNPLDTILPEPGSWNFNTFGGGLHVQGYPNPTEGAHATARTLTGYPGIVGAFRSGQGLCGNPSLVGEFSTWSGGGYQAVC